MFRLAEWKASARDLGAWINGEFSINEFFMDKTIHHPSATWRFFIYVRPQERVGGKRRDRARRNHNQAAASQRELLRWEPPLSPRRRGIPGQRGEFNGQRNVNERRRASRAKHDRLLSSDDARD